MELFHRRSVSILVVLFLVYRSRQTSAPFVTRYYGPPQTVQPHDRDITHDTRVRLRRGRGCGGGRGRGGGGGGCPPVVEDRRDGRSAELLAVSVRLELCRKDSRHSRIDRPASDVLRCRHEPPQRLELRARRRINIEL